MFIGFRVEFVNMAFGNQGGLVGALTPHREEGIAAYNLRKIAIFKFLARDIDFWNSVVHCLRS